MEKNKFEKKLKEQLEGREIRPSENAWGKVSEQLEGLEIANSRDKSGRFPWLGIAAGFIGILFLSMWYFGTNEASVESSTTTFQEVMDSVPIDESSKPFLETPILKKEAVVNTEIPKEKLTRNESDETRDGVESKALASIKLRDQKPEKVALPMNASDELIHTKVAEIVARVEVLENNNDSVTEAEIDSLLHDAQREILADKIFRNDNSVDAMALLADVEDELDQSFRDQIFDALKDGFLKVRTAVADRNK